MHQQKDICNQLSKTSKRFSDLLHPRSQNYRELAQFVDEVIHDILLPLLRIVVCREADIKSLKYESDHRFHLSEGKHSARTICKASGEWDICLSIVVPNFGCI